jgi:hypothetical protein
MLGTVAEVVAVISIIGHFYQYWKLEGPDRLLDWGVRSYRRKGKPSDVLIQKRLRPLLELWSPTVLVIRGRQIQPRNILFRKSLLKRIATEAKSHRVPVRILKISLGKIRARD